MGTFRSDESGQIIVIAALLIAVLFVGLALVLNSAIYAENMATRGDTSTAEAMSTESVTEEHLGHTVAYANEGKLDSYSDRRVSIRENVSSWNGIIGAREAKSGRSYTTTVSTMKNGSRISQDSPRQFKPEDEDLDEALLGEELDPLGLTGRMSWLVAPEVETRGFEITAETSSLKNVEGISLYNLIDFVLDGGDPFGVIFDEGDHHRTVYLVQSSSSPNEFSAVISEDDGENETVVGVCSIESEEVTVDFDANSLIGEKSTQECDGLSFTDQLGRHNVTYVGADNITGTYQFFVDKDKPTLDSEIDNLYDESLLESLLDTSCFLSDCDPEIYNEPGAGSPYTTTAIYDVSVESTYQDNRITYTRNVTFPAAAR